MIVLLTMLLAQRNAVPVFFGFNAEYYLGGSVQIILWLRGIHGIKAKTL
jgi:hypothetical protein